MKKLLVAIALFSLLSVPAFAQDTPAFEIFGGYQLIYDNGDNFEIDGFNYHGFTAAVEGNITSFLGIVGEVGYFQHSESVDSVEAKIDGVPFLFGPRVSLRTEKFRVFGHYLLGGMRNSIDITPDIIEDIEGSETNFAQAIGGGIDIAINDIISIRPAQIDLLSVRFNDNSMSDWSNHFRYSGGIVLTF